MIPWLIYAAEVVGMFAVMNFAEGKKQEATILTWLFVAVFAMSCAAIFLEGYLGGESGWLKTMCIALNLFCLLRLDDAKKKKRKRKK